jgi:hypothetical protein
VDSIERFLAEPVFNVTSDQDVANLLAFMLAFSGSELPAGSTSTLALEPPGTAGRDAHAAVGAQTTLVSLAGAPPQQTALIGSMLSLANAGKVGLVAKGRAGGLARGWRYDGGGTWQSDRAAESLGTPALQALAAAGSELTFTVVPAGSQTRLGVDRDLDGVLDRDELDACSDPADPQSLPGDWSDLGAGLAGAHGVPFLGGCGSLLAGDPVTLTLTGALENTAAHLFVGASVVGLPFKGGTLVPALDLTLLFLPTGGVGSLALSGPVAPGLPAGFALYFQFWINDPAGPVGFAASNAVRGVTP